MGKIGRRTEREQSALGQLRLPLRELVREALFDTVIASGLRYVEEVLEDERSALCGPRYAHLVEREAMRAGHVTSSLTLGGRRAEVRRPRARSIDGRELSLPSWAAWSERDPLERRAIEQMLLGVSTRRYARSLEPLPEEVAVRGVGKSVVSDRFVVGTTRRLFELTRRKLNGLKLVAVMIDGVRFADHVVLAAIGIDLGGKKHVLGLREGATEAEKSVWAYRTDGASANRNTAVIVRHFPHVPAESIGESPQPRVFWNSTPGAPICKLESYSG